MELEKHGGTQRKSLKARPDLESSHIPYAHFLMDKLMAIPGYGRETNKCGAAMSPGEEENRFGYTVNSLNVFSFDHQISVNSFCLTKRTHTVLP